MTSELFKLLNRKLPLLCYPAAIYLSLLPLSTGPRVYALNSTLVITTKQHQPLSLPGESHLGPYLTGFTRGSSQEWFLFLRPCPLQFSSVGQLCPTLCDPMNCSTPGLPSVYITSSQSSLRLTSIESVMPSSHLILCRPLLLLPLIPPSIRVFSNESTLRMRWPKYWSFRLSISPSDDFH